MVETVVCLRLSACVFVVVSTTIVLLIVCRMIVNIIVRFVVDDNVAAGFDAATD